MPFQAVKHQLDTLDAQPTPGGGVLVLVTGKLLVRTALRASRDVRRGLLTSADLDDMTGGRGAASDELLPGIPAPQRERPVLCLQ